MPIIHLDRVTVSYPRAPAAALNGVSLTLEPGIVGIVGPNGAGKTTLFRLLLGMVRGLEGAVTIDGMAPDAYRNAHPLGFIPEHPVFAEYLTVGEFLGGLHAMVSEAHGTRPLESGFGVGELAARRLGELSLGQKRKVELVAAMLGEPLLVLLDEPTNGLDPLAVAELREAVLSLRAPDRLILIASHNLDELQRVVDRVVVLREGRVAGSWTREEALTDGSLHDRFHQLVREPAR